MGYDTGKNTGVGCHFLLQGIFLDQGSNLGLPHWQADSLLSRQGSPCNSLQYVGTYFLFNNNGIPLYL